MTYRIKIWRAKSGWRWTAFASNGRKIAESGGDGYRNYADCTRILMRFLNGQYKIEGGKK